MILVVLKFAFAHREFLIRSTLVLTQPQDESPCVSFLISVFGAGPLFGCSQNINYLQFSVLAFRDVIDVPLAARKLHKTRKEVWLPNTIETLLYIS